MMYTIILRLLILQAAAKICALGYDINYDSMPPLFALEDYGRCVRETQGLYCMVQVEIYSSNKQNELMRFILEYSSHDKKHFNYSIVERGICVTKACKNFIKGNNIGDKKNLIKVLDECLNKSFMEDYGLNAKLSKLHYCDKHGEEKRVDDLDNVFLGMIYLFLFLNIIGSAYDAFQKEKDEMRRKCIEKYLACFSVQRNWDRLISEPNDSNIERLKGFYGIKSIIVFLAVFSHVPVTQVIFSDNPQDFEKNFGSHQILNIPVLVQINYVITSFLLAYKLKIRDDKHTFSWKSVPEIVILRLARLTPVIALMVGFSATWQRHLNSGPFWKMQAVRSAEDCRMSWWWHLLFFTNYKLNNTKYCAPHLWYVSSEFQLYIFGLILYVAIRKLRVATRSSIMLVIALIGSISAAIHVWAYDLDGTMIVVPEFLRTLSGNDSFFYLHVLGHINLPGFMVGMGTGLIVHHLQGHPTEAAIYKICLWLASWSVYLCIPLGLAAGWFLMTDDERAPLINRMLFAALNRVFFAFFVALGLTSMILKIQGPFSKILELRFWRVIDRLSYCIFLLHMNVILILSGSRTQLAHMDMFYLIFLFFGVWVTSFILALAVYLFVESPIYMFAKNCFSQEENVIVKDIKAA